MQCQCMWDAIIEILCRVFVIDVTDRIALVEATAELITTASHPEMRNKPLWLVFNKIDLPGAIPEHELALLMRLADLQRTLGSCMQVLYRHCSAAMPEPARAEAEFFIAANTQEDSTSHTTNTTHAGAACQCAGGYRRHGPNESANGVSAKCPASIMTSSIA